jgi:uncharacterized phage protein (TIGR01671 family)
MKRQIKFRVWDGKSMTYPDAVDANYMAIRLNGDVEEVSFGELMNKVEWYIPLQFTGLQDNKGKEIYEGDIVKGIHYAWDDRYYNFRREDLITGVIKYQHSYWRISNLKLFVLENDTLEVIGNIYENPELLLT